MKTDVYKIAWDKSLGMYVMYLNDNPMMKSKTKSTLAKKLMKWLMSQGQ